MSTDTVKHNCGLFGVFGHAGAAYLTRLGLQALQHRGQESAGICTADGQRILRRVGMGLVGKVFSEQALAELDGPAAIGHVRYSTAGSSCISNAQPLVGESGEGQVAIAHNGTLVNAIALRREYERRGHVFETTSDTEVIMHLLADPEYRSGPRGMAGALERLEGAYSLLILYPDRMVAIRDPLGFRPLCLGDMGDGSLVAASETCALDMVGANYIREVAPGEIVTIRARQMRVERFGSQPAGRGAACVFEHIYFADASSRIFGESVQAVRVALGAALAREAPIEADVVVPVPNSARYAAVGYSGESGVPVGRGFSSSKYNGRSFILPEQSQRDLAVRLKLKVDREAVCGKRLVVVEDSVVRGTTARGQLRALREAGAREVHLRVASPPLRHPCFYGIDFPDAGELVAAGRSVEEIRRFLGVDSLHYLSVEGMLGCMKQPVTQYCTACFTADYPLKNHAPVDKFAMEDGGAGGEGRAHQAPCEVLDARC